jgi:hypothetical protein
MEYENDKPKYTIQDAKVIKAVYFNRLSSEISKYYFTEYDKIRTLTCELNRPLLFDDKINTCPEMLHIKKSYDSYSSEIKDRVQFMLNYLKDAWTCNNNEQFKFILQWISNMARGNKNQSVLYLKGEEGIGKSTFTDFLVKHVIGQRLSLKSGSQPLISNFNSILFCKLLVVYEELENFGTNQWQTVSTRIKRDITSDTCQYESKGVDSFEAKNISNVIINSNVDAIKDDNGRRIFCLDLSNKKKGDIVFWKEIYSTCMNNEVGEAFYNYLLEYDISDYFDQSFPVTKMKSDSIVKRLDHVFRFIKEKYVLEKRDLKISLKDLYQEYVNFSNSIGTKPYNKIDFNKKLSDINLIGFKSGNIAVKFSYQNIYLLEIATKHKWLHETDHFELSENDLFSNDLDKNITDEKDEDNNEKDNYIRILEQKIKNLEAQCPLIKLREEIKNMSEFIKTFEIEPISNQVAFENDIDTLLNLC